MLPMTMPASAVNNATVRELERTSIRKFVMSCAGQLTGRVLDYGCGKQPYRDIVEEVGGTYYGFDRADFPANVSGEDVGGDQFDLMREIGIDSILCNQMLQYLPLYDDRYHEMGGPLSDVVKELHALLERSRRIHLSGLDTGYLILTYPTTWAEVEPTDLTRFTAAGMHDLLTHAGFTIVRHEQRAHINLGGFRLPLGYGVLARA